QRLSFTELRATHAKRASHQLQLGDVGALMRLRVRAQRHALRFGECRHRRNVALKRIAIDHQRRRVERNTRPLSANQMAMQVDVAAYHPLSTPKSDAKWSFANLPAGSCSARTARNLPAFG